MSKLFIYGASGHGKVVLDAARCSNTEVEGFIDDNPLLDIFEGLQVYNESPEKTSFIIAIGSNTIRKSIHQCHTNLVPTSIKHPSAIVSDKAKVNTGTFIAAAAVINPNATIGQHCIINSGAIVEHDCIIEDYVHISPNATVCGNVQIGEGTHIGAGAVVLPGVTIGKWVTIGAGSVVIRNVPDNVTAVGNPARIINT